jgi:hypothetical protein
MVLHRKQVASDLKNEVLECSAASMVSLKFVEEQPQVLRLCLSQKTRQTPLPMNRPIEIRGFPHFRKSAEGRGTRHLWRCRQSVHTKSQVELLWMTAIE